MRHESWKRSDFGLQNSTLSQASADKKSQFEATWEAPANSSLGDIQFLYVFKEANTLVISSNESLDHNSPLFQCPFSVTFVRDYTSFWTMVNSSTIRSIGNQSSTTIKPPAASQQTSSLPVSILIDMLLFSHNQVFDCSFMYFFQQNSSHKNRHLSAVWLSVILHALILHSLFLLINLWSF